MCILVLLCEYVFAWGTVTISLLELFSHSALRGSDSALLASGYPQLGQASCFCSSVLAIAYVCVTTICWHFN